MEGCIIKIDGWMNYHLRIAGENKARRIHWRNHNRSYIKRNSTWIRVYFNHWVLDLGSYAEIPMVLNEDGEWEMVHEYEELPGGASGQYAIVK